MLNYFYEYVGMFCHKLTQSAVSVVQQYSEKWTPLLMFLFE